ncbi:MAG: F0F1 ATP synthase subunit A [Gemmatimonadetes bacterium]|nr:F0F1 ATP synthase subunit A [Gemmatimonadota bacterium]
MMQEAQHGASEGVNIGEIVLHHTSDGYAIDFEPFGTIEWHKWPDIHIGGLTLNLTPTKHVVFMIFAAALVLVAMWYTKRSLIKQRAHQRAPTGFAGFIEQLVLWIREDLAIANIGKNGPKYAPFLVALFFFILAMNLLGLVPWGATATGNLAVTAALALMVFLVVEIGGFMAMGAKGYLGTIFPHVEGVKGIGGVALTLFMAPIELLSKFTKPFALAVRLFGNMVAGHFVILSLIGIILLFGSWIIGGPTAIVLAAIMLLETLVAALQAYVFVLLASTFIGLMQEAHH